ncbi:MAG: hypothetical protein QXN55_00045 [Candidatus Nitrosotenuis sp.]
MGKVIKFPPHPFYKLYQEIGSDIDTYEEFLEWLVTAAIIDSEIREKVLTAAAQDPCSN